MKHFIVYNSSGEIIRAGQVPDEAFSKQAGVGEFVTEGQCDLLLDSVDLATGQVIRGGRPVVVDMDYRKGRALAYPPVEQQLDALWHAMDQGVLPKIEPLYSHIATIKAAYPKDNSVEPGSVVIYPLE